MVRPKAPTNHFHSAPRFGTAELAHMLDSLVRVSRRGKWKHFVIRALRQGETGGVNSPEGATSPPAVSPASSAHDLRRATGRRPSEARRKMTRHQHCLHSLPFQQFQALFNSLFKVLCIFPSRYLFAIGLPPVFSFRWSLPPVRAALPSNSTRRVRSIRRKAPSTDGTVTLYRALFQGTSPGAASGHPAVDYNSV